MPWYDNNSGTGKRDNMESSVTLLTEPPVKTVMRAQGDVSNWFSGVLVAYPKPSSTPKEYTNSFTATIKPTSRRPGERSIS